MQSLQCPVCRASLEPTSSLHGLVWLCRACRAGAATVPILRHVVPRAFVNRMWQAALHEGRTSSLRCPSCGQPFTAVTAWGNIRLEVCVGCCWVWLGPKEIALPSSSAS